MTIVHQQLSGSSEFVDPNVKCNLFLEMETIKKRWLDSSKELIYRLEKALAKAKAKNEATSEENLEEYYWFVPDTVNYRENIVLLNYSSTLFKILLLSSKVFKHRHLLLSCFDYKSSSVSNYYYPIRVVLIEE